MTPYQYKPRRPEDWDKRAQQSSSKFAGWALDEFNLYAVKKGENWIRILPPTWDDPRHYGYDVWVHFGVGPDNGTVICLWKMGQGACPVCEAQAKAEAVSREDAGDLKPTRRVVIWLIDRLRPKEKPDTAFLWAMPWTVDRDISILCKDRQTGELYQIDHPEVGFDISFQKEGEGVQTRYVGIQLARKPSPVEQRFVDYIIANPIPKTLAWRTYEEIQALFEGQPIAVEVPAAQPIPGPQPVQTPAAAPMQRTPLQPQQAPQPVATAPDPFCQQSVTVMGTTYGCVYAAGHSGAPGNCKFERPLASPAAVAGTPMPPQTAVAGVATVQTAEPPATPPPGMFEPRPPQPTAQPAATATGSTADRLRSRFTTGK